MISIQAIREAWATWWRAALGAAIAAGPCLLLGYCSGQSAGKAKVESAVAVATVETMKVDGNAKEVAANERLNDLTINETKKEELTDAVASFPDDVPSVRRVALACARLRQNGTDTSTLPACR